MQHNENPGLYSGAQNTFSAHDNTITVERISPCSIGNLRAFVVIRLPDGTKINGFRIVQQLGQAAWVSAPQNEYLDKRTGQKRYQNIIEFPEDLKRQVNAAILAAWASQTGGRQS